MKKTIAFIAIATLALAIIFAACEQNTERPVEYKYLPGGAELAQELGGLYFKEGNVSTIKGTENGQERLQLILTNGGIKPHTVNIFLETADWSTLEVNSGKYEVLYLKQMLILNEPQTGLRYTFRVNSEGLQELEARLPASYRSDAGIDAIGIAFRGPLPSMKGNPAYLSEVCHSAGGPGTLSCSNACCTITCKTGYYASCGQSCNCTKEE